MTVRIRLCGELVAEPVDDRLAGRLSGVALASRKGRQLLGLLAVERGHLVATERIADVLWEATAPRDAAANVATLVSRLRSVLGEGVVDGTRAAYGLLPGGAWTTDVDDATHLVDEAAERHRAGEDGLALAAATRALDVLGRHEGLDDVPPDDWVAPLREQIGRLRRAATHLAVAAATRTGDQAAARAWAEAAVAAEPLDEQAHRDLMAALAADGQGAAALAVYADLQRTLRRELGVDPHQETRDLHLALLRGSEPPASRVGEPGRPGAGGGSSLLGRAGEVAALTEAWSAAVSGAPSLVLVTGEAGIGKSRLLAEVESLVETTGGMLLSARCHASERSLFLQPVVDALRGELANLPAAALVELAGVHVEALVTLLPQLSGVLAASGAAGPVASRRDPEVQRRLAYEAVAHVLARLARSRPVLLALDDLQDSGLATVDLLDYLSRHLDPARVLLVAAARNDAGGLHLLDAVGERTLVVTLGRLPLSAVTAMAAAAGQAEHAAALAARTSGHPFSVVEMLRALSTGEPGIPASLAAAVLRRVDRAGPDAEPTLQAAAVLGTQVDPTRLAGLLDVPELAAVRRCESLVLAGLLARVSDGYEFANDLVQEVVYGATPPPERQAHHRRAADLLADHPEAMARHAEAVQDWTRAARGWLLAGQQSVLRAAARDAVALLDQAAAAARRAGTADILVRVLLARASAREAVTDYEPALADLDEALEVARAVGDRRLEMVALRGRGGDVPVALRHPSSDWGAYVETGLRLATELGDRVAVADFSARLAVLQSSRLQFDQAFRHARLAVRAGRASGDDAALAGGLDGLKNVYAYLGDVGPLAEVLDELTPLVRRSANAWLLQWCVFESSFAAMAIGDVASARARVDEAIVVNEQSGFPAYASFFLAHRGWMARLAGELDVALDEGDRARHQAAAVEHPWWMAAASGLYAATLLAAGRPDEAADVAAEGLRSARGHGAEAYLLLSLAPLAEATGDREALGEAADLLASVTAPAGQAWVLGADAYLCVGRALLARGDAAAAQAAVAPLLRATGPGHWPAVHAQARAVDSAASSGVARTEV